MKVKVVKVKSKLNWKIIKVNEKNIVFIYINVIN